MSDDLNELSRLGQELQPECYMSDDVERVRDGWRLWLGVAFLAPVALALWLKDAALAALTDHPGHRANHDG